MDHTLTIGTDLNGRKINCSIPNTTEITALKYIAKVNSNNYIAENKMAVEGQTGECSVGYYHYLNGDQAETAIFYLRNSEGVVTNLTNFTLPDDFGVCTEIDETAVLYDYLTRNCHEKVYVICEDFCKEESLPKNEILDTIDSKVKGYAVPINSIFNYDGNSIPDGYEEFDDVLNFKKLIVEDITGKNILDISTFQSQTISGVSFINNYDGSITVNGVATADISLAFNDEKIVLDGNYAFGVSADVRTMDIGAYCYKANGDYKYNITLNNPTRNFSDGDYIKTFFIGILNGTTINNERIYPQLEKGTTPTNFVKPKTFGVEETGWINANLVNDWQNVGGNYNPVQYKREGNKVYVRGTVVKNRALSSNDDRKVFSLISNMWPEKNYFGIHNGQEYNITLVGDVYFGNITNYTSGTWVSLDGLYFFIK